MKDILTLTVHTLDGKRYEYEVPNGSNLREVLLDLGHTPYVNLTQRFNCGGRGLCATCGVHILPAPEPTHWHDRLAAAYGYPRLSCQITLTHALTVYMVEKWIWGKADKDRKSG